MDAEARFRWLQKLASEFPGDAPVFTFHLTWENKHGVTSVSSYPLEGIYVSLHGASHPVESLEEAVGLLRRIFADELVCVTAFARGEVVQISLAEAHQPNVAFGQLDTHSGTPDMPQIDDIVIETWSTGLVERD